MSATQTAMTKLIMIPKKLSEYPFFRYAHETQDLMNLPLSEVATFEWGALNKSEAEVCAMYFVIFGHVEASTEELLKAAGDLGISNNNLANAAVIAKNEDLYKAAIAKIDPDKFEKEVMEWVYALASFGTPKMYDAFVNQLQELNIEILPRINQSLSVLFSVTMHAENFDMMLHFITLTSPSSEKVVEILVGNKMKPYYEAAEKGRLDVVVCFQEKMTQVYDSKTLNALSREAFDRATHFGHVQIVQYLIPLLSEEIRMKLSDSLNTLKQFKYKKGDDPTKITFSSRFEIIDVVSTILYQICTGNAEDLEYWLANPKIAAELTKPEFRSAFAQGGAPEILKLLDDASARLATQKPSFSAASSGYGHFNPIGKIGENRSSLSSDSDFDDVSDNSSSYSDDDSNYEDAVNKARLS